MKPKGYLSRNFLTTEKDTLLSLYCNQVLYLLKSNDVKTCVALNRVRLCSCSTMNAATGGIVTQLVEVNAEQT